ncbi:proline racemase family protein [Streptomyces sp. NPDC087908]|uniref:proline racemase family protein n=1 Tax=unclassified Streptomyces TaxID=2593676 RepID=UPI0011CE976A|nr:proline racemase family protein [Streptomyces sp. adm13(2018)]TXS22303.1 proline racemase [Streptomyces sp. adm13(2018)]
MRSQLVLHTVESHTEGMPTRVVTGGVAPIPGATMAERRQYFLSHLDHLRTLLMFEPRGHSAMSGAILQPSTRPDADWGVLFIEVSGCLPMCGHGAIGVATVLVETGMVPVTEPRTVVRLDTPAGLVVADVEVAEGRARGVTLRNVPSYVERLDAVVEVAGHGRVRLDLAYGGNFYAILPIERVGLPFDRAAAPRILSAGAAIMDAVNEQLRPVHPESSEIAGCHHVQFVAPGSTARHSRHAMAIHPGWFDRSPCGTGTSARLAQLHARGELDVGDVLVNESFIGSRFTAAVRERTTVAGRSAVVPAVTGRAWLTGTAQYFLDPTDPFPAGFLL